MDYIGSLAMDEQWSFIALYARMIYVIMAWPIGRRAAPDEQPTQRALHCPWTGLL